MANDEFKTGVEDGEKLKNVEETTTGAKLDGIDKSGFLVDNPVTKILTLGGWQYSLGKRAIAYGVLGAIVEANALANNVAAKKFEEEADHYDSLAKGMEDCSGGNCQATEQKTLLFQNQELPLNTQ